MPQVIVLSVAAGRDKDHVLMASFVTSGVGKQHVEFEHGTVFFPSPVTIFIH